MQTAGEKTRKETQAKLYDEFCKELKRGMQHILFSFRHLNLKAVFGKQQDRDSFLITQKGTEDTLFYFLDDLYKERAGTAVPDGFEIALEIVMHFESLRRRAEAAPRASGQADVLPEEKMFCQAVNAGRNAALLENVPHERLHDLAFVVKCETGGDKPVLITHDICGKLGLNREELFRIVSRNSRREGYQCMTLASLLRSSFPGSVPEEPPLYVLKNARNLYGASALLFDDVLYRAYETIGESFYVLPSSIHELILVPASIADGYLPELRQIVRGINSHEDFVPEEDYLSDNIYYYDEKEQTLELADTAPKMSRS